MKRKKWLSVLLAAVFAFGVIGQDFACAANMANAEMMLFPVLQNSKPQLFDNFAKITDFANFGGETLVLNIQDFHLNPEVQKNISSIIDILVKNYGIKNVYVEGASGKVSTSWLSDIKDEKIRKEVTNGLLDEGALTASEYYASLNGKKDFIYGIEDAKIHDINVKRLAGIIELKPYYAKIIERMSDDLDFLQNKYFNVNNKRFENFVKRYKNGKIAAKKYYATLFKYLNRNSGAILLPADARDYPNIVLFLRFDDLQKRLNESKLLRQLNEIILKVKETLPYSSLPKNGDLDEPDKILAYLQSLPKDFQEKYFSLEIQNFITLRNLYLQINPVALIKEERTLINEIRTGFAQSSNELEISFLSDFFLYFSDYMTASISADNYEYLLEKFEKFETLWEKHSYYNNSLFEARPFFDLLNAYYAANDKRNGIFLDVLQIKQNGGGALKSSENFEELLSDAKNISVVITGGYHSKGVSEILKQKGISYAVLTPYVNGDISKTLVNYENLALEQAGFPSQTLALALASQSSDVKKAQLLFSWAQKNLVEVLHTQENINFLIEKLNESSGGNIVFTVSDSVIYANGKPFADISENKDGKITIKKHQKFSRVQTQSDGNFLTPEKSRALLKDFYSVFNATSLNFGSNIVVPNFYPALKSFAEFASKNKLFRGGGLVFDIAGISNPKESIDDVETRLVARMPDFLQKAINENQIKKEDFKNNDDWLKFLWVSGLLNDFISGKTRSEKQKFSLIKSLFYAPFSELEEISAAIAAKASGDDSLYEKFINKHNYDGKQKDQLSSGVLQIYNAVINLLAKHAGARRIRNTVIRMHFAYNLKVILKAFFQNFVRAFKGERFIYPAVMTVSVVVKKKNAAAVIKNIDEIRKLHPEAIIPENVESLTEGFNIEFDDEETAETFRTGALRNFILAERNAGANNEEKNSAVQVAADTAIAAVKPISFPSSLADIISNEVIEDITKENRFTYNDRDGFVKNALSKTVKEIINNPQSDKARSVKRQLKSFGVSLGSVKTDKEKSLILTDSGEGSTPFSIEIRQDGTISKYYYVQRDGSGGFNDKSPIIKSASLLAYTGISLYKAVNALLVFGDSLPESKSEASLQEKDENYKQDEVLLVYADESLDKISLLIRLLFEGADDLGTVLRQTEEANAARRHFEKLGITFEYDDLRYLNKDSVLVYKNNKPILRLVFGNALGKIRFHNLISVVNVETRKEELKQQEKNKDLFYLFDLLALTDEKNMLQTAHLDGKEVEELSNAQKVFKDLFDYSSAIKNGDITYLFNKRGDYDVSKLLRYQTSDLSAQEQSYLELRAPSAAVKVIFENNGLATFYFDPSNRREAQKLISEIENAKAERAQKENVDYSWRENKDALKKLAQNLYSDFTKDVSDGHINKIKTQYDGVFIEADGFYTNPENAAKARINFNGSFIDIEDGEIFVYTRRLYDADGNPLKYLFKQKINDSSQIDAKELKEFINFLISYGAQLNDVSLQTSVPAAAEFTGKSYAGKETIAALTNAAAQVFLDHNSYNENALVKLLKEKYGAETDFSQYFFNYTGFDLSLFNEKDKDPYLERRRGSGVLSLKIPNSPLGDLYLFIADGKIWFDYRNGYANFRSWHYSNTEEEIAGLYAKDNAVQNALYSDAFVANAQSADGKSVNVLLSNILEDIIKYGSAQNAGNQKKQLEGISLYEGYPHKKAVSQGLAAQKDPEEVFKYYSEHMKGEVAVGAAYVPTQNTLYLAQAVKKVFEEKDFKNSHIKKYFDGLLKKFPYPAEILLTSEGVEIRVGRKDKEAQEDFRTGIIINKDGRVLEIKDRQYADENKQRFVQINNTLYLTSPQNQDSDLHYLYSGKELTELTGVKYKAQRNGIVKFSKKHDFSYEDLDENNIEEFAKALYSWVGKTGEPSFSKEQLELAVERIKHFGIKSGFVRVNGKIAAFAVGEYVGDGEFDIYIQKSDNSINGLINTINHLFIRENFSEGFLNFEEDLSIEGLRKMKLSYFPLNKTREYGDADLKYHSGILFTGFIEEAINYGKEEPAAQESEALEEYKILKTHISKAGPVLEKLKEEFDGKYTQNQDANGVITFEVSPEIYEKFKEVLFPVKKTAVVAVGAALGGAAVGALPGLSAAVAGAANAGSDYSDPQVQKFLQRAVEKIIENPSLLSVFNKDAPDAPSAIKAPKALIGISKGGQKYLYITPNQSDLKFNVIIYPYDYKNVKAGQPVKGFIADKESGRFEDLSQVSYAAVSAAAAETIEKLIDLGKTLPETKTEKPRQENIVSELIEIDAAFDSLGVLAKSLFDSYKGDKKTWENIEKTLKDRLKAAGIDDVEFEVSDEVRYLNCDYFSVSVKGEKLFTVVFGHPIYDDDGTLIKFQNVINIIDERSDAANRKRYPDSTKHEDLLHLSDLAGFRAQDIITSSFINENPDSPVSKTLKILTQTADALSGKKLKLSGGSNMPLRYQVLSKHILAKDIEELKSISADAKSLDGVETFYFNLKDRQNAQELINRAKTNYENDVISKAQNYSLPENKSALTNAAKSFWLGYINGEKNEILEKFKEAGVKIISADLYSDANKAGNIIISAEGSREFLEITDGVISYYAQRAYDPEHNLFGPLFSKGIEYSSQIKNSALLAALNAVLSHGKNIDAASLDKQIQAVPNVLQIKENKTKYLQSREALKKAALKTAVDYAFNRLGLENVLKEYIDKNGLEIDYSHYRRNYSGTDLRSYKPEEADPYYDRRNGKYVINIKIPTQEFGDVYLFIAEGKIWFDTQNGYAVYRAAHFSSAEEEIGAAYSKERAWQNVQYPESFILQPHSKAARELNALLTAVTGKIIEYGAQFDEEELNKEHEGIDLYELAAYKNDQEKFEGEHLSRPMKTQIAMGGNYVPTQNTRYLAQAVKDILQRGKESKDPAKFLKEQFKDIFENFPENEDYSYELAADGNSILLKFPAQNNGEIGIIIKDDGSALEIKDDWYSEQNGDRYAHVFNTRFLGADKNPGADYSYLYYVRELVELAGKENYKKRNQIISFDKKNNWVYEDVTPENIGEFADALGDAQILGQAFEGYAPPAITEEDALRIFERLRYLGFYAGFLRVNGKIEAFSLAHGEGTLVYSIQKANTKINGTPQAINREFMNSHSQNTDYANFEESFRVEPLTKFKLHDNHPLSYTDTDYAVVLGEQQNLRYYAGIVSQSLIKGLIDYAKNLSETDGSLSAANLTADSRAGEKRLKSESSLGESPIDPGSAVKNKTAGLSSVLSDLASFVEYRKWLVLNMIKNPTFRVDATYEYAQSAAEYVENYAQTFPSSYETKKLKDGDTVNIIVINGEVPEFHKIYEFENTGLKSEGEILWRSKETGRYILYTKAKNLDKIALTANSSLENIIGVKGKITANSLTIDPRFKDDGVSYDVLGNTVVGKEYLAKLSELTGSSLPEVISQIRKEQKAEKLAIAGNFIMNLDYARSQKELLKAVGAFNNSGSAQIAVPLKLFENKTESEIAEIVSYISQRQIRVFAFEDENTNNIYSDKELIALGFAGHAYKGAKETTVIDYLIGNINSVDEIKNFNNETDLEKQIEKSRPDSTKLVSVEDYLKLLSGDDIELKIKKIAGFFSGEKIKNLFYKKITPQYAINTAYALDYAQIPDLNLKDFIDIVSLAGKPSQRQQLKHILRIDSNAALKTAYDRIEKNAVEDGKEAALLAFLKGAAQKARVKADFPQGLNDPDIENLALRSALSDYASNSSYVAGFPDSVKTETGLETITRNELSKHLKIKAQQLALIDQEAATIYELILYYGDRKLKTEINESAYKIDPNAISKLLSAA